jgi:hypothetical protein
MSGATALSFADEEDENAAVALLEQGTNTIYLKHTHTHTHIYTHSHTHTHTHTHTQRLSNVEHWQTR